MILIVCTNLDRRRMNIKINFGRSSLIAVTSELWLFDCHHESTSGDSCKFSLMMDYFCKYKCLNISVNKSCAKITQWHIFLQPHTILFIQWIIDAWFTTNIYLNTNKSSSVYICLVAIYLPWSHIAWLGWRAPCQNMGIYWRYCHRTIYDSSITIPSVLIQLGTYVPSWFSWHWRMDK